MLAFGKIGNISGTRHQGPGTRCEIFSQSAKIFTVKKIRTTVFMYLRVNMSIPVPLKNFFRLHTGPAKIFF